MSGTSGKSRAGKSTSPLTTPVKKYGKGVTGDQGRRTLTPSREEKKQSQEVSFQTMLTESKANRAKEAAERAQRLTHREAAARQEEQKRVTAAVAHLSANEKDKLESTINKLYATRTALHTGVDKIYDYLDEALDDLEELELATKLNTLRRSLDQTNHKIIRKDEAIEELLGCDEVVQHITEAMEFQQTVFKLEELLKHHQVMFHNDNPESTVRPKDIILTRKDEDKAGSKMPLLEVPTFSGDYKEYSMFIDQFDAMIGSKTMANSSKLQHLKKALRGDAKASIFRLGVCGTESYERARNILEQRYGNKRLIARSFVHTIVTYTPVKENDGPALRGFITALGDSVEGLGELGVDLNTWDVILVYHVLAKIDPETQRDYNMKHPSRELPQLDELVEYLNDRAVAIEDSASEKPPSKRQDRKANTNALRLERLETGEDMSADSHQTSAAPYKKPNTHGGSQGGKKQFDKTPGEGRPKAVQPPCPKCHGPHALYKCVAFEKLDKTQRKELVKKNSLCFNCLRTGHGSRDCKSNYLCGVCKESHHTMLHDAEAKHKGNSNHINLVQRISGSRKHEQGDENLQAIAKSSNMVETSATCLTTKASQSKNDQNNDRSSGTARVNALFAPDGTRRGMECPKTKMQGANTNQVSINVSADSRVATHLIPRIELPTSLHKPPLSAVGLGRVDNGRTPLLGTMSVPIAKTLETKKVSHGRALLDNCSQINFVSDAFCRRNNLMVKKTSFAISTVGCAEPQTTTGMTSFYIPLPNGDNIPVDAYLFSQVTNDMPSCELEKSVVRQLQDYDLADSQFEKPKGVDMLLGVEVFNELVLNNKIKKGSITLTETHFGYVITGSAQIKKSAANSNHVSGQSRDPFVACCYSS